MSNYTNLRSAFAAKHFPGIGDATVNKLFSMFTAQDLLSNIANKQTDAFTAGGIKEKKALALYYGYLIARPLIEVALFLDRHDFSLPIASKVYELWGWKCMDMIKSNPYRLLAMASWKEVDPLGLQSGPEFHPCRLVAAIQNCIYENYEQGKHTAIDKDTLREMTMGLISCCSEKFNVALQLAIDTGAIVKHQSYFQAPVVHLFERRIEQFLLNKNKSIQICERTINSFLDRPQYKTLTQEQYTAVKNSLIYKISVVHGRGGRGKTYTLSVIADITEALLKKKLILCAVTAKACQRLSAGTNRVSSTIASLLHLKNHAVFSDSIVIIDEASMLSLSDAYHLFRKLPSSAHLVLLGDPYQIPSIGAGRVFYDIIQSNLVPNVELTVNRRQDQKTDNQLNQIISGEFPVFEDYKNTAGTGIYKELVHDVNAAEARAVELYLELARRGEEVQLISPLKHFVGGSDSINDKVHMALFRTTEYSKYTPVVWKKNLKIKYGIRLTNGSVGFVKGRGSNGNYLEVAFENEGDVQLTYDEVNNYLGMAYCLTVHKAQGSEWENVIVLLPLSERMLDRNMIYTALSRCKKRTIIVYHDHKFIEEKIRALPVHQRRLSLLLQGGSECLNLELRI
ncbi:AAA family ATPase [Pelosinus sp. sgz500959]|uniref:AAA family ATPase n=1 Tax=Pelosinus sp. sgz500959 TaxID=3242472 RepID=UPI003670E804